MTNETRNPNDELKVTDPSGRESFDHRDALDRLIEFQSRLRDRIVASRGSDLASVARHSSADTIYAIDAEVDPLVEHFCEEWSRTTPLVLIAEGIEDESGKSAKVFPHGAKESDAKIRVIMDPIDGTRGIMYDKRSAWTLAGVAPNLGDKTRLRDIEVAVMSELPTSKMDRADVLWATRGGGSHGKRDDLHLKNSTPLTLRPSIAKDLSHGFAAIGNFFPGTKVLAAELMEFIAASLNAEASDPLIFDDQYICTGGQMYELIVGHDRFIADLRPLFCRAMGKPMGLCVHPYDVAAWLIAEEAGVILTNGLGNLLDGPLDVTTPISWAGFANDSLHKKIQPLIVEFFARREIGE